MMIIYRLLNCLLMRVRS